MAHETTKKPTRRIFQIQIDDEFERNLLELQDALGYKQKSPVVLHALRELHRRYCSTDRQIQKSA